MKRENLLTLINKRQRALDYWTIHVNEIAQWRPRHQSFDEWFAQACVIYDQTCKAVALPEEVVCIALEFEPSMELETFQEISNLKVNFRFLPALYVLKEPLKFPASGEEYYRIIKPSDLRISLPNGIVIVRSARSVEYIENGWEFDNTLYITSRFGDVLSNRPSQ